MATKNDAGEEVFKVVLYGPPQVATGAVLRRMFDRTPNAHRTALSAMSLGTPPETLLFFEMTRPAFLVESEGLPARFHFAALEGNTDVDASAHEAAARFLTVRADAVGFVADTRPEQASANLEWFELAQRLAGSLPVFTIDDCAGERAADSFIHQVATRLLRGAAEGKASVTEVRDWDPSGFDDTPLEEIQEHVERHVGPVTRVFHEVHGDAVRLDLLHVAPTEDGSFQYLVTSGMSSRPMNVPDGEDAGRDAELIVCLPSDWPVSHPGLVEPGNLALAPHVADPDDPRIGWPAWLLTDLVRKTHKSASWLWNGHVFWNGDPPEPYAPRIAFCGSLIVRPVTLPSEFRELRLDDDRSISFFAVVPLYREELRLTRDKGVEYLGGLFDQKGITEAFDIARPNVGRKRVGFF